MTSDANRIARYFFEEEEEEVTDAAEEEDVEAKEKEDERARMEAAQISFSKETKEEVNSAPIDRTTSGCAQAILRNKDWAHKGKVEDLAQVVMVSSREPQPGAFPVEGLGASSPGEASSTVQPEEQQEQEQETLQAQEPIEASLVLSLDDDGVDEIEDPEEARPGSGSSQALDGQVEATVEVPKSRCRRVSILFVVLALVLAAAVIVPLVVFLPASNKTSSPETNAPETEHPTASRPAMIPPLPLVLELWSSTIRTVQEDPASPQYKANAWLSQDPNLGTYPAWRQLQRFSMAVKYYATNGPQWHRNDHWLSYNVSECLWYSSSEGPICNEEEHVLVDDLRSNNLQGTIPREMFLSPSTEHLDYSHNHLHGQLPIIDSTGAIQVFRLRNNSLQGPITVEAGFRAPYVRIIDVAYNHFVGSLHFPVFPRIQELDISHNDFDGSIPSQLEWLTDLSILRLEDNHYTGTLPSQVGYLTSLQELDVSENPELEGSLPETLEKLTGLELIDLTETAITGRIPPRLCSPNTTNLVVLANCSSLLECC